MATNKISDEKACSIAQFNRLSQSHCKTILLGSLPSFHFGRQATCEPFPSQSATTAPDDTCTDRYLIR